MNYDRSGGLAGVRDALSIHPDGEAKVATRRGERSFRLTRAARDRLARAVRRADLTHVKVPKSSHPMDVFLYTIRYRGHKVSFDSVSIPRQLRGLLAELDRLLRRYGPR